VASAGRIGRERVGWRDRDRSAALSARARQL